VGHHGGGPGRRHRPLAVVCQVRRGRAARPPPLGAARAWADEKCADRPVVPKGMTCGASVVQIIRLCDVLAGRIIGSKQTHTCDGR
jgi:hypothetical protein